MRLGKFWSVSENLFSTTVLCRQFSTLGRLRLLLNVTCLSWIEHCSHSLNTVCWPACILYSERRWMWMSSLVQHFPSQSFWSILSPSITSTVVYYSNPCFVFLLVDSDPSTSSSLWSLSSCVFLWVNESYYYNSNWDSFLKNTVMCDRG